MKQHICEKCSKDAMSGLNTFLSKGKMVCRECYAENTKNNTVFIDETPYLRR